MKKSEYRGFSQVFRFTVTQAFRSKSFVVTMLLMIIVALVSFPVLNSGNKIDEGYESPIEKVYVINSTDISDIPFKEAFVDETGYDKVTFENADKEVGELTAEISKEHDNHVVLDISLSPETGGYSLEFFRDPESGVEVEDVSSLADVITEWFEKYKVLILDADEETLEMVGKVVDYTYMDSGEYLETEEHEIISDADYNVVYIFLCVAYFVIVMAASMVSSKVVEEKANRVVEYLMTTVRPMALILGKVVAMLLVTVTEIGAIALAGFASSKISDIMYGESSSSELMGQFLSTDAIKSLSPMNIVFSILLIATGILIYGLLAGLFGASVSKMEDLQQGLKVYTFIILIAFFVALTACEMMWTTGINGFVNFCMIFPFTSVMILPGAILIGKATVSMIIAALILQVITALIVLKIVSLIYESIIVMNGNPVSVKQMVEIMRRRK